MSSNAALLNLLLLLLLVVLFLPTLNLLQFAKCWRVLSETGNFSHLIARSIQLDNAVYIHVQDRPPTTSTSARVHELRWSVTTATIQGAR